MYIFFRSHIFPHPPLWRIIFGFLLLLRAESPEFGQLNISSKARDVKLAKTDVGTRGEVKFLDIREK